MPEQKEKLSVFFISTECYPVAKVGGLADVTGALPKYLDYNVKVILPKYKMPWFKDKTYEVVYQDQFWVPHRDIHFTVQKVKDAKLGFPFYVIDIPGLLDRDGVYADSSGIYFEDEAERYTAFQRAFLQWVNSMAILPDIIHCQDHHTGLTPFMMQYTEAFQKLKNIPTIFTIHNERYQGAFPWQKQYLLPAFDTWKSGLIDWDNHINPLAAGIKCADAVSTVSPSYMEELKQQSYGLEWLFNHEADKLYGILNGIDNTLWDPKTDPSIHQHLKRSVSKFKADNKKALLADTLLDPANSTISFIGRFAVEKGADLLPGFMDILLSQGHSINFVILGTGDKTIEQNLDRISHLYPNHIQVTLAYNEKLAHQMYAASDYLIMPSRVEPCGLNQMYALRYGTIPIVHSIGGLHDSIIDISEPSGYGIKFDHLFISDIIDSIGRAVSLYDDEQRLKEIRKIGMAQDFSWEYSAKKYATLYENIIIEKKDKKL